MLSSEARHTLSVNKHDTHMRTSRTLSVSMPPAQLRQVERLAKKENRTLSELVREALRRYQQKPASPAGAELIAALRAVQEDARRAGLGKLPQRAIEAEVAAYRREQRQARIKQPVRRAAHVS
jgi:Arc/MetJ-type ribon-helix-helix transcriptional regulator